MLLFLEALQDRVNVLERVIDLLAGFGSGEHNFARDEDEEHDAWFDHAVDESREQLWLVAAELAVRQNQALQADGELDIAAAHHVLNLEIEELCLETELLHNAGVLPGCEPRVLFTLSPGAHHLARTEDQSRRSWLADSHDDGSESFRVVLCVTGMQSNFF